MITADRFIEDYLNTWQVWPGDEKIIQNCNPDFLYKKFIPKDVVNSYQPRNEFDIKSLHLYLPGCKYQKHVYVMQKINNPQRNISYERFPVLSKGEPSAHAFAMLGK